MAVLAALVPALRAVYAPIPELEQGRALTLTLAGGFYHDSNIFGGSANRIDSMVYQAQPKLAFNASLTPQTFSSAGYDLSADYIQDRPGSKHVLSHKLSGRIAHAFSPASFGDVTVSYLVSRNPESLLAGLPLHTEQSHRRHQADFRYGTNVTPKISTLFKFRTLGYRFDAGVLAAALDRAEHLGGIEAAYSFGPDRKLVAEYRFQDISYRVQPAGKDKRSHFGLVGVDYYFRENIKLGARAGVEDRTRRGAPNKTSPYAELTAGYNFRPNSFIALGYAYSIEETSSIDRYTDTQVNRALLNVQHGLTPFLSISGSLTYESSVLQGRGNLGKVDEDGIRAGVAATFIRSRRWSVSATFDRDSISSGEVTRNVNRSRTGLAARRIF